MNGKQLYLYLKKSFLSGSLKTVIVSLSTVIFLPLIIQKIGIEQYGLISLTMIFGGMTVFADFGVSKSVTILIGKKNSDVNLIVSNGLTINFSILVLLGCCFILVANNDYAVLGDNLTISNSLKNYIILVGFLYLTFTLLNNLLVAILEAYFLVHYVNSGYMLSSVMINCAIYVASILSESIYYILIAPIASTALVTLYFVFIVKKKAGIELVLPNVRAIKSMLSLSYRFMQLGVLNSLVIPFNKYLIIYITGSSALLGIFDIGLKLSLIALSFLNSITQPLMAVFSNSKHDKTRTFSIIIKVTIALSVLYVIGLTLFFYAGKEVVRYIDKDNYEELFTVSLILLLGVTFSAIAEPFYKALLASERLAEALYLKLTIPILNALGFFLLREYTYNFSIAYSLAMFFSSLLIIIYFIYSHIKVVNKC